MVQPTAVDFNKVFYKSIFIKNFIEVYRREVILQGLTTEVIYPKICTARANTISARGIVAMLATVDRAK